MEYVLYSKRQTLKFNEMFLPRVDGLMFSKDFFYKPLVEHSGHYIIHHFLCLLTVYTLNTKLFNNLLSSSFIS